MKDFKEKEIADRIDIIGRYYDIEDMLAGKKDKEEVSKYYRLSDRFYNLIHSRGGGNNHMGLSDDGLFHHDDFMNEVVETVAQTVVFGDFEIPGQTLP